MLHVYKMTDSISDAPSDDNIDKRVMYNSYGDWFGCGNARASWLKSANR